MRNLSEKCVLLFVKDPAEGGVKTRLAEQIGVAAAAELYRCFLFDMLEMLNKHAMPFEIAFYPPQSESRLKYLLGSSYRYTPQRGEDLGQRMKNAFSAAFDNGYEKVVLIGSDLPDLPGKFIKDAFVRLETSDVVIGPAADKGYYLIGFSRKSFTAAAFENILWSSAQVFNQTLIALKNQNKTVSVLPVWNDMDTIGDLQLFVLRGGRTALRTFTCISKEIPQLNCAAGQNHAKL